MTKPDAAQALTERQRHVLPSLVAEPSIEAACRSAKISKETVYRWLRESPAFVAELKAQRDAVLADALDLLRGTARQAVETLLGLLQSEQETIRERAAGRILDYLLKVKEADTLRERLDRVERLIDQRRLARDTQGGR